MTDGELSGWLRRLEHGDPQAVDGLVEILYSELRHLAHRRLAGERRDHTLRTTALVQEAYLKLRQQDRIRADDRSQFLAAAGNTMYRILIDYGRTRRRLKRGGGAKPLHFDEIEPFFSEREVDELLALDEALQELERDNPDGASIIRYRFFAGLSVSEIAELRGTSTKTVQRKWAAARAWLRKEMLVALPDPPP